MLDFITTYILIGISGFAFALVCRPSELLGFWGVFIYKAIPKQGRLHKVLYSCEKCIAGQFALWHFIFLGDGGILHGVFAVSISIVTAFLISKYEEKN